MSLIGTALNMCRNGRYAVEPPKFYAYVKFDCQIEQCMSVS